MGYYSSRYYVADSSGPVAPTSDIMAAVVAQLRNTPSVVAALGEDLSSLATTKIWADDLAIESDLPWLTYSELSETLSPQGPTDSGEIDYIGSGSFTLSLLAADKLQCRQTAYLIVAALNDAPLNPDDCQVLEIRHTNPTAPPVTSVGPNSATIYKRILSFEYVVVRTF
jgi:hypothetical protein